MHARGVLPDDAPIGRSGEQLCVVFMHADGHVGQVLVKDRLVVLDTQDLVVLYRAFNKPCLVSCWTQ